MCIYIYLYSYKYRYMIDVWAKQTVPRATRLFCLFIVQQPNMFRLLLPLSPACVTHLREGRHER